MLLLGFEVLYSFEITIKSTRMKKGSSTQLQSPSNIYALCCVTVNQHLQNVNNTTK